MSRRRGSLVHRMRTELRRELNIQKRGGYISNQWLRKNPWRLHFEFNPRKFEPSKHKRILLAGLVLFLAIGLFGWAGQPTNGLFHSFSPNPNFVDPLKPLWFDCLKQTSAWQLSALASATTGVCSSANTFGNNIAIIPNATTSGVALTLGTVTIDQASTKVLEFDMVLAGGASGTFSPSTEMYLTKNGTLPNNAQLATYDPYKDSSVAFIVRLQENAANNAGNVNFYMQTDPTKSIQATDGSCPDGGSVFACMSFGTFTTSQLNLITAQLNYTGTTSTASTSNFQLWSCPGLPCTSIVSSSSQTRLPNLELSGHYYLGLYVQTRGSATTGISFYGSTDPPNPNPNANNQMNSMLFSIFTPNPPATQPPPFIDTGGFFGPIIKVLISIGVFVLNAVLAFIGFIVPALEAAFNFLETIVKTILNGVGVAFGFPGSPNGLGDNLFNFINSVITLFSVQVPNAFGQIANIFSGWVNLLTVIFTTGIIGQIFKFLSDTLTFAVNLASFAWTVFNLAALTYSIGAPWWLFIFAIAFNCDDGVEGWIKTWEFAKWLAFDIGVKTITWLLNWTIDVVTAAIGFIPKPMIQMASAKFPRIPVIDIHGSFSIPRFDGAALKEGNLFAVFGFPSIVAGLIWYELTQTSIPGTLASLYSTQPWVNTATVAITFYKIFLPIFGLTIFLLMVPTLFSSIFGIRVEGGMPVSLGSRPRSGIVLRGGGGGPLIRRGEKHLQGRLLAKISEREKIEKRVRSAIEKEKEKLGAKATEEKAQAELAKKELARKSSGKDIKGPRLGPLDQE